MIVPLVGDEGIWNEGVIQGDEAMAGTGYATIELTRAEALVFFDFLARFNEQKSFPFEDQSEQRILWDIEAALEKQLVDPLDAAYVELLKKARQEVRNGESK